MMNRTGRIVLIMVVLLLLGGATWFVTSAYRTLHRMAIEDAIVHSGDDIISAIDRYEKKESHPPASLAELVPEYLPAQPAIEHVDQVEYVVSGANWSLRLYSGATWGQRVYVFNSTLHLTDEESSRSLGSIHGWDVLRAPTAGRYMDADR